MNASQPGTKDWWLVVQSMPPEEALLHLHDYRAGLLVANAGKAGYIAAGAEVARINEEIKRINRLLAASDWQKACRAVLPSDLYEAVCVERARLQAENGRDRQNFGIANGGPQWDVKKPARS